MSATVHVKNISTATSESEVREFFSFCGKISSLSVSKEASGTQSATVTFEKPTAAKTALLLDNTQLGNSLVQVSTASTLEELSSDKSGGDAGDELSQEDKPRSRIVAEYLAHGYVISDKAIERAIALDNQHGVSARFTNILQQFDAKYQATAKAQEIDQKYAISQKAASSWQGLATYFEKALGTPTGQKIRQFYDAGNKQVTDVHNEARRLADLKAGKHTPEQIPGTNLTKCNCSANEGVCGCAPGNCRCADCGKNPEASSKVDPEKAGLHQVSENPVKTKCNCAGAEGSCACEAGKCDCADCGKNTTPA